MKDSRCQERDAILDMLRIVATIGVVVIHMTDLNSWHGLLLNTVARFSVPVFFMLSGYCMLSSPIPRAKLNGKCLGLLGRALLWSCIYFMYSVSSGALRWRGDISSFLDYLLEYPVHLWYIYALVGLYLFLPAYFAFAQNVSKREYKITLLLLFLLGSLTTTLIRAGTADAVELVLSRAKMPYLLGMPFMFLLGGYLQRYLDIERVSCTVLCSLSCILVTLTVVGARVLQFRGLPKDALLSFFSPLIVMYGIVVFILFLKLSERYVITGKAGACIEEFVKATMGVYFVHLLLRDCLHLSPGDYNLVQSLGSVVCLYLVSTFAVWVLQRIPLIRKLVS